MNILRLISAEYCNPLIYTANSYLNTSDILISEATVICYDGYLYRDGRKSKDTTCHDQNWDFNSEDPCISKFTQVTLLAAEKLINACIIYNIVLMLKMVNLFKCIKF